MADNHNYKTPAQGTLDWHVPLNDNFSSLDTDVEIRDTDANKANYTPKQGAKYLATDTGDVYLGDGSAWQHLGSMTNVSVGSTAPSDPSEGDLWIDTS